MDKQSTVNDTSPSEAHQGPSTSQTDALELIRQRRDHYGQLYFKMEDRAQFFAGILLAAGAAFLGAVKAHIWDQAPPGWCPIASLNWLERLTFSLLFVSFCGVFITLSPLRGRTLFDGKGIGWLERWTLAMARWPSCWARERESFLDKPAHQKMPDFLSSLFRSSAKSFPKMGNSLIWDDEVHNLWAQWFVYMRRALLLRKTIFISTIALAFTGYTYFQLPPSPDEPTAATATAPRECPQEEAPPPPPSPSIALPPPQSQVAPEGDPAAPATPSTSPLPEGGSPEQAPASAPAGTSTGNP